MKKINVIDSMPSAGKTRYMIGQIKTLPASQKVIYITPLPSETVRIKEGCTGKRFCKPDYKLGKGSKQTHLKDLVSKGKNIATTHALFMLLDDEALMRIKEQNYILVMDEVVNVVKIIDAYEDYTNIDEKEKQKKCKKDIQESLECNYISKDDDGKLTWVDSKRFLDRYSKLKELIETREIYLSAGSVLFELFPHKVFTEDIFKEIFIMTYQFEYQLLSYYFEFFEIPYEKFGIKKHKKNGRSKENYSLVSHDDYLEYELELRKKLKAKIHIIESEIKNKIGKKDIGSKKQKLSVRHYKEFTEEEFKELHSKTNSFISDKLNNCTNKLMWTVYKDHVDDVKTKRMSENNFVPLNSRATNDYRHKSGVVYLVNRFVHPYIVHLFWAKSIRFKCEEYALTEMLQFIFRSAIRDNLPIDIYIPSERMRLLLIAWLNGEY